MSPPTTENILHPLVRPAWVWGAMAWRKTVIGAGNATPCATLSSAMKKPRPASGVYGRDGSEQAQTGDLSARIHGLFG